MGGPGTQWLLGPEDCGCRRLITSVGFGLGCPPVPLALCSDVAPLTGWGCLQTGERDSFLGKGCPDLTPWVWRRIRGWSGFGSERPGVERGRRVSGRPPTPHRPGPHVFTRGISHHNKVKGFVAFLMLFGLIYILTW